MMHSTSSVFGSGASCSSSSSLDFIDDFNFGGDCIDGNIDNTSCVQTEETTKLKTNEQQQQHVLKKDSTGCNGKNTTKNVSFSHDDDDLHHSDNARDVNLLRLDSTLSDYNDQPVDISSHEHHDKSDNCLFHQQHSDSSYSFCLDPAHSNYSSFLSSCDSDVDNNNDLSKKQPTYRHYNIKSLSSSSTAAATVALKAVGTTTFTAASAAAGALSKISVRDSINSVKPLLSNKKKINPLLQQDGFYRYYENKIHVAQQQPTESTEVNSEMASTSITNSTIESKPIKAPAKSAEKSNCSESTSSAPLAPPPIPSTPSFSTTPQNSVSFKPNTTANDDKDDDYDENDDEDNLVLQAAMPTIAQEPSSSSHDIRSTTTVWIDRDGQVLQQFDAESGRGYDIDVAIGRNLESATENESIFVSQPFRKETMKSERNCSSVAPVQQLHDDIDDDDDPSTSTRQPEKGEQSAAAVKNILYDAAHTALASQSQYWWGL